MNFDTLYYAILYGIIFNGVCSIVRFIIDKVVKRKKINSPVVKIGLNMVKSLFKTGLDSKKRSKKKKKNHDGVRKRNNTSNTSNNPLSIFGDLLENMGVNVTPSPRVESKVPSKGEIKNIMESLD